jgi:hypothetical protein
MTLPPGTGDAAVDAALLDVSGRLAADPAAFMERLACAYHEAGHAVVGTVLGWRVESAEIYDRPTDIGVGQDALGAVRWASGYDAASDEGLVTGALVALAGPIAEAGFVGGDEGAARVNALDGARVDALIARHPKVTRERVGLEAARLARKYWRAIEATALELNAVGRVDGRTVAELVRAARPKYKD